MKILKPGIKQQYYRFTCPNCHCEFVADISEITAWGVTAHLITDSLIAPKFSVKCPDCEITDTLDGMECDENGNQIIRPIKHLEVAINS